MGEHNVTNMPSRESIGTVVYAAIDGVAAAEFELDDEIRPGAKEALERPNRVASNELSCSRATTCRRLAVLQPPYQSQKLKLVCFPMARSTR